MSWGTLKGSLEKQNLGCCQFVSDAVVWSFAGLGQGHHLVFVGNSFRCQPGPGSVV